MIIMHILRCPFLIFFFAIRPLFSSTIKSSYTLKISESAIDHAREFWRLWKKIFFRFIIYYSTGTEKKMKKKKVALWVFYYMNLYRIVPS